MLVVGVTGGIGVGKSTISKIFKEKGAIVIDADDVGKDVVAPQTKSWKKIVKYFGEDILAEDGSINRRKLGDIVFSNREELAVLDSITHPVITEMIKDELDSIKSTTSAAQIVIIDAPLLIETGLLSEVDATVVVMADYDIRIRRLKGLNFETPLAEARIRAQTADHKRLEFANYTLWNEGTMEELKQKADELWNELHSLCRNEEK